MKTFGASLLCLIPLIELGASLGCSRIAPSPGVAAQTDHGPSLFTVANMPSGEQGKLIHAGRDIFVHTPVYASKYVGAKVSCADCHINGGTAAYAAPMIDLAGIFPMYNKRAGHQIGLNERIQECFTRSENGSPPATDSPEMKSLLAYVNWLSRNGIKGQPYKGRGFVKLAVLEGDVPHGQQVYVSQCAACHGVDGAGVAPVLPPIWGQDSYNDGAGMNNPAKMAAFLTYNMPQNHPGTLTPQQAWDVSAYVHSMPRPKFNEAYKSY